MWKYQVLDNGRPALFRDSNKDGHIFDTYQSAIEYAEHYLGIDKYSGGEYKDHVICPEWKISKEDTRPERKLYTCEYSGYGDYICIMPIFVRKNLNELE